MLPLILYFPMAVALAVLLFYSARGALLGYGKGRLIPLTLLLAADLGASLYLMCGVGATWSSWVAVGLAALVAVPLLTPVTLLVLAALIAWLTGKPMRWN